MVIKIVSTVTGTLRLAGAAVGGPLSERALVLPLSRA
jgi:hypothetical protein